MNNRSDGQDLVSRIQASRKYRSIGIPEGTILDVYQREMDRVADPAEALRSTKAKLHNILALYLGDLDYPQARTDLDEAFARNERQAVGQVCAGLLARHHSTRERLAYYPAFFRTIQEVCGRFDSLLDLACGLNPFALPLVDLPVTTRYHAYDIHTSRVELIKHFFTLSGRPALAEVRDVLVQPPRIAADAAILLKEAHRMEKRRVGAARELVLALNVRLVFISLPNRSMDGRRDLRERMRSLTERICGADLLIAGCEEFPSETLFWLRRMHG